MTTQTVTPQRPVVSPERDSFWYLVHAEWTKFRTVRGWVIAVLITIVAIGAGAFLGSDVSGGCGGGHAAGSGASAAACPAQPTGPGGEPVQDVFYFAHQPVTGNGTITVQMTSLTGQFIVGTSDGGYQTAPGGLQPWSKAGIIIKQNTSQGSAYAAMMVTGSHGVRMQWDYVNDTPGPGKGAGEAGGVSASAPRWLRLARDGDTITGYDSADGTHWTRAGTAILPGLTSTVQAGLFAAGTSIESYPADFREAGVPDSFGAMATGVFRHIRLSWPATGWTGTNVGGAGPNRNGAPLPGTLRQRASTITVAGEGDISPAAGDAYAGNGQSLQRALAGTFSGLIPLIVVAAMFMTAEYRRRLIRVSLTAAPRRGRLLAAKAVVIGAVGFVAGLFAATLAVAIGTPLLLRAGPLAWPVSLLTEARMVAGTGALLAVAAVLALAIGTIVRRSAPAVAIVILVIVVPYLLAFGPLSGSQPQGSGPGGGGGWPLQITPAAALSLQQAVPQFHQLLAVYPLANGYYPLAPWAGLAVECAWAAAALALAFFLLRRRDA
jgi:ABC-type transport system involved in multi-copper enzyme maturation permease subunit